MEFGLKWKFEFPLGEIPLGESGKPHDKGDIFLLEEQREKYKWLNSKEKERINFPIYIQNLKVINICANYNGCYAIGDNGNLYKNYCQNFKKISLPENIKKFL